MYRQEYLSVLWSALFSLLRPILPPSAGKQDIQVQNCHWFWNKLCAQKLHGGWGRWRRRGQYRTWPFIWCIKIAALPLLLLVIQSIVGISLSIMCWFSHFAFKTWIYLMHCFITKDFSNFILIVSKWLTLYVQLGLVICIFSTCVPREKGFFKRTKVILFYNVVLLSIWLWHSSLTSVISLCLGLLIHIIICQRSTVTQQEYSL